MSEVNEHIRQVRKDFAKHSLDEKSVNADPVLQFGVWMKEVLDSMLYEPNAFILATATASGVPSARVLLLRDFSNEGFTFFTNYNSRKSKEMLENPNVSLVFYWPELERQVRIEGKVEKANEKISDDYFASRPRGSQIGAHVSPQSQMISARQELENLNEEYIKKFGEGVVPRPSHWGGFVVKPTKFEFWQGRPSRLHDRIIYEKKKNDWNIYRLAP